MKSLDLKQQDKEIILNAQEAATKAGAEIYLVGGAVRSFMLNKPVDDYDFVCMGNTALVAANFAMMYKSRIIVLDEKNGVLRVILPQGTFADFNDGQDLQSDAKRRDFSLNALYLYIDKNNQAQVIDPLGGLNDLEKKELKAISASIFNEDPLRLLRAFRLSAEFGLKISPSTYELIEEKASLLKESAPERKHEEWSKICRSNSSRILPQMAESGVLTALFPVLEESINVGQPPEHHWDVFNHSIATACAVDYVMGKGSWPYLQEQEDIIYRDDEINTELHETTVILKSAAVLHDIGKPCCRTQEENGRIRFIGHPIAGENMCRVILPEMRFSRKESAAICALVRDHMRPTQLAPKGQMPSAKAVFRFYRDNPYAVSALYLSLADHLATSGPNLDWKEWCYHNDLVKYIIFSARTQEEQLKKSIPISGSEVINYLHLPPSPWISFALAEAHAAQAEGAERNEALRRAGLALDHQLRKLKLEKRESTAGENPEVVLDKDENEKE